MVIQTVTIGSPLGISVPMGTTTGNLWGLVVSPLGLVLRLLQVSRWSSWGGENREIFKRNFVGLV